MKTEPNIQLVLDIDEKTVTAGGELIGLEIADSARTVLLRGSWDTLNVLLQNSALIEKKYGELPYLPEF